MAFNFPHFVPRHLLHNLSEAKGTQNENKGTTCYECSMMNVFVKLKQALFLTVNELLIFMTNCNLRVARDKLLRCDNDLMRKVSCFHGTKLMAVNLFATI